MKTGINEKDTWNKFPWYIFYILKDGYIVFFSKF
jgi:hypothetical protein